MMNQNNLQNLMQFEGKQPLNQIQTIFIKLQDNVLTASMLSSITDIPQKNICRYKRDLEKAGMLWEVKKTVCKKTGFKAWYLTTNPTFSPIQSQLKLF
jgi:predicted transcriptional regulator